MSSTTLSPRRAIIVGGSMAGLYAAARLHRAGWDVHVYERTPVPLEGRGAGIVTHPEIRRALAAVGRANVDDLGCGNDWRVLFDRDGRRIQELHRPQIATSWNRLYEILKATLPPERYHLGRALEGIEQTTDTVTARFADGSHATGDVLIGADGFRSAARAILAPHVQPTYAGYVAWRGMAPEAAFSPEVREQVFPHFAFCLPPGEQIIGYTVAGPGNDLRPGHRNWNVVWYRPADESTELRRLLTDETGREHQISIPPPLIARHVVAEMHDAAARLVSPQFQEAIRLLDQPFIQPIYDLAAPRIAFGRACLVGDSASQARPHVGAGVAKAFMDVDDLVAQLGAGHDVPEALAAFDAIRVPINRHVVAHAQNLGAYIKRSFASEAERSLAAKHAEPRAVLWETAFLDFLRPEPVEAEGLPSS